MSSAFMATFTGFTGAQYTCPIYAYDLREAREIAEAHMCEGDLLTIEGETQCLPN
jgi:hypothetical protein